MIEQIVTARERDIGGFSVRRLLPYANHRMVGPFIFFDHMGPAELKAGVGMDVRPHPHIHLATVTYLFEGRIRHRDSLGSDQLIEPGAINWMTAGRGIVHSERSPEDFRESGGPINGIQCWVALPDEHLNVDPSFKHHPSSTLPEFEIEGGARAKLLLGSAYGKTSPVQVHSEMFYLELKVKRGQSVRFPARGLEAAAYVAEGAIEIAGQTASRFALAIGEKAADLEFTALEDSRVMILGGASVGPRVIFWNFVSTTQANLDVAKNEWANGPGTARFPKIPGDEADFIPLPQN